MAARANPKKKKAAAAKGRVPSRGTVAKLPKPTKRKKGRRGDNSGDHSVPDEIYERHLAKIDTTSKAMEKAKEAFDQAKGVHQSAYKAAKGDGCDIDAIRLARKLDKQDAGVTQVTYANVSRVLNLIGSPLGSEQMDLFGAIAPAKPAEEAPGIRGLKAGEAGLGRDANPYDPGSQAYQAYDEQWLAGQKRIVDRMGNGSESVN